MNSWKLFAPLYIKGLAYDESAADRLDNFMKSLPNPVQSLLELVVLKHLETAVHILDVLVMVDQLLVLDPQKITSKHRNAMYLAAILHDLGKLNLLNEVLDYLPPEGSQLSIASPLSAILTEANKTALEAAGIEVEQVTGLDHLRSHELESVNIVESLRSKYAYLLNIIYNRRYEIELAQKLSGRHHAYNCTLRKWPTSKEGDSENLIFIDPIEKHLLALFVIADVVAALLGNRRYRANSEVDSTEIVNYVEQQFKSNPELKDLDFEKYRPFVASFFIKLVDGQSTTAQKLQAWVNSLKVV